MTTRWISLRSKHPLLFRVEQQATGGRDEAEGERGRGEGRGGKSKASPEIRVRARVRVTEPPGGQMPENSRRRRAGSLDERDGTRFSSLLRFSEVPP